MGSGASCTSTNSCAVSSSATDESIGIPRYMIRSLKSREARSGGGPASFHSFLRSALSLRCGAAAQERGRGSGGGGGGA